MIDTFRIKEALREIGKENKVYSRIFEAYENLQREKELLEKKLEGAMRVIHDVKEKMEAQMELYEEQLSERTSEIETLKKDISGFKQEIQRLNQKMSTMVPRDNDAAKKEAAKIAALQSEFDAKLREKDDQWKKMMSKLQDEMVELKSQASGVDMQHREELKKLKERQEEEMVRLRQEIDKWKGECESKTQEISSLKNKPGDYDGLNKSKLEMVGRKKGWNVKMIPYLVKEADVDIDDLRDRLQKSQVEISELKNQLSGLNARGSSADSKGQGHGSVGGGGGADSEKSKIELEQLRIRYAQSERDLQDERNENARLKEELAEMAKRLRDSEGSLQLLEQMREENQQMKVAMEEMRLRLAKLEQLARKNGAGKEFREFMNEVGLSEQLQGWLLQNVFERLYRDALARHKRLEDRWLKAQSALSASNAKIPELLHLGRTSLEADAPMVKGLERITEPPEVHNVIMTWATVTYPSDGMTLRNARVRVHKLLAERSARSAPTQRSSTPGDARYWPNPSPSRETFGASTNPNSFTKVSLGRGLPTVHGQDKQKTLAPLRQKVRKGHPSSTSSLPAATQQMSSSAPSVWQNFMPPNSGPNYSVHAGGTPSDLVKPDGEKLVMLSSFAKKDMNFKHELPKALPDRAQTAQSALPMAR